MVVHRRAGTGEALGLKELNLPGKESPSTHCSVSACTHADGNVHGFCMRRFGDAVLCTRFLHAPVPDAPVAPRQASRSRA